MAFLMWTDDAGTDHVLLADIIPKFDDTRQAEVTEHAVEEGADIADHVIQKADTISFEIAQTQTPIEEGNGFDFKNMSLDVRKSLFQPSGLLAVASAVSSIASALFGGGETDPVTINVLQSGASKDRIADIHDELIRIKESAALCTIAFLGRTYPSFVITSITLSRVKGEAGLGRFAVEARRIRTTSTEQTADPASLRMRTAKANGKKPAKEVKEEEKKVVKRSLLKQGLLSTKEGLGL